MDYIVYFTEVKNKNEREILKDLLKNKNFKNINIFDGIKENRFLIFIRFYEKSLNKDTYSSIASYTSNNRYKYITLNELADL